MKSENHPQQPLVTKTQTSPAPSITKNTLVDEEGSDVVGLAEGENKKILRGIFIYFL